MLINKMLTIDAYLESSYFAEKRVDSRLKVMHSFSDFTSRDESINSTKYAASFVSGQFEFFMHRWFEIAVNFG